MTSLDPSRKHVTVGHVMRRNRCGLTQAKAILGRLTAQGVLAPVYSQTTGKLLHHVNLSWERVR